MEFKPWVRSLLWGFVTIVAVLLVGLHVFLITESERYFLEGRQSKAQVFLYSFWTSVVVIPFFMLNAGMNNVWGVWRARRLARRFPGKLVYSIPIPPHASALLGVLLPPSIPRTTVGFTVVADSDALEVWWGLRSRRCARVPWGEIESISRGETPPVVSGSKNAYWVDMRSKAWPASFQTAILATPWSMGLYARASEVDRVIAELTRLKDAAAPITGAEVSKDPTWEEGNRVEQPKHRGTRREGMPGWEALGERRWSILGIWGLGFLLLGLRWATLAPPDRLFGAAWCYLAFLVLASSFFLQGLSTRLRSRSLRRRSMGALVTSVVAPLPALRLQGRALPLPFNRLTFGVTLVVNHEGVSFWHGVFPRRYALVPWSQIESVGVRREVSEERELWLVFLRMTTAPGPHEFAVMGSVWTFGLCALEDEARYVSESIGKMRDEQR